jgi:hypothetical protein
MKRKLNFLILLSLIPLIAFPTQSFQEEFKFYGRGHVDSADPVFGDEFLRLLIKGDKGAIVDVISHYGIVVIRMDLEKDQSCSNSEFIFCFNGTISDLKNVDHPNVGSELSLKVNLQEDTWNLSIHSGNMAGTNVLVFLENIGSEKKPDKGNLWIDWSDCVIEFDKNSNKPQTLKIMPFVLDDSNNQITSDVKSKFRFSFDSDKSDTSHVHLDNKIIEEFIISSNNPEPLILNITNAIEKAEDLQISQIQVESRHYTVFPPIEGDAISYNNEDQVLLEFIHQNEGWEIHQGLCKSKTTK